MEKRYLIREKELRTLVRARAINDILQDIPNEYNGKEQEYIDICIADFGCRNIEEVVDKLIIEFGYEVADEAETITIEDKRERVRQEILSNLSNILITIVKANENDLRDIGAELLEIEKKMMFWGLK